MHHLILWSWQKNVLKSCVIDTATHATFDHVPAAAENCPWRARARARGRWGCFCRWSSVVRPTKYETFCRANGVIVAVIDWSIERGGGKGVNGLLPEGGGSKGGRGPHSGKGGRFVVKIIFHPRERRNAVKWRPMFFVGHLVHVQASSF